MRIKCRKRKTKLDLSLARPSALRRNWRSSAANLPKRIRRQRCVLKRQYPIGLRTLLLIRRCYQEEHKRLEDTEKKSRLALGDKLEDVLARMDSAAEDKQNPRGQTSNIETDDLYALHKLLMVQNLTIAGFVTSSSPSSNNMIFVNIISNLL